MGRGSEARPRAGVGGFQHDRNRCWVDRPTLDVDKMTVVEPRRANIEASHEDRDGESWVHLEGELDPEACDHIAPTLLQASHGDAETIVIDLSGVSFVSSMGIALLIRCYRDALEQERTFMLSGLRPTIRRSLDLLGVLATIPVRDAPPHDADPELAD